MICFALSTIIEDVANASFGPVFGRVDDLCIGSNANQEVSSCADVGHTHHLPTGITDRFVLTGSPMFTVL